MKVYLVIVENCHHDADVAVYSTPDSATARAREIVEEYGFRPVEPDVPVGGWLFWATLSSEGEYLRVEEAEVR